MDYLINISFSFSIISMLLAIIYFIFNRKTIEKISVVSLMISFVIFSVYVVLYSVYNRIPLSNQYESVLVVLFFMGIFSFYFYYKNKKDYRLLLTLFIILPLFLAYLNIADNTLKPLMPALRSNWLFFHVITAMISYSFFMVAGIIGVIDYIKAEKEYNIFSDRFVKLRFFFLTIGIITGSIWAESAWNRYWSWDPKEVWSLITWLYYGILIHIKNRYLNVSKFNIMLFVGIFFVIFTYFGVNYLLGGLHGYV